MVTIIITIIIVLVLLLFAIRVAFSKTSPVEQGDIHNPLIHESGIYSIVRKTPRDALLKVKPTEEEIRKYLSALNENLCTLASNEIEEIVKNWNTSMENSIKAVEIGDNNSVEFYFFDFDTVDCPICNNFIKKGQFVTREEIYKHPELLPPFHLNCSTILHPHHGKEDLRETTELGMMPFFKHGIRPALPDWKSMQKQHTTRGSK
ncbi:MAG TPA: hypothetical protein VHO70_00050 [Chitinispirillaceae bacterium]|nr:hypothetical protein [Chitinispirillaceae bacterium]